jgi:hypothetical protein
MLILLVLPLFIVDSLCDVLSYESKHNESDADPSQWRKQVAIY